MPTVPLFGLGFNSKSSTVTSQKLTNLYREPQKDADKSAMALYGTPGLSSFADLGASPSRGARSFGSYIYIVVGNTLYEVNAAGTATNRGTLNTSSGRVGMSDNGTQIMIVDGTYGYTFNTSTNVFAQITDVDFVAGSTVTFIAGYFVVDNPSGRFRWSALYDGTAWAALDFATAESNPDPLLAVRQHGGELYLFGTVTTEVWAPSGDTNIFRRVGGAGIEWGLAAPWTLDSFGGGLIFLAKNRNGESQVVVMNGYQVQPVSGPEENHEINNRTIGGATGYSYMLDGHSFYQLNFPDESLLYDGLTDSWGTVSSAGGRHYGEIRVELSSISYVSDYRSGKLYRVGKDVYLDVSDAIQRTVVSRHLLHDFERFTLAELVVDFEVGVGLSTGQGSDPQAMLQISKDNGKTWGNEMWATIGAQGNYQTRAVWRRLGRARDFVIRLKVSDPVKVVITSAAVKLA